MYDARVSRPTCVDLFAGAGGATQGLRAAGFDVVGAVELDHDAAATYRMNHPETRLWQSDIRAIAAATMRDDLGIRAGTLALLKACPPCQGFSSLARNGDSIANWDRNDLVLDVIRFVRSFRPASVLVENVPGLERDRRLGQLCDTLATLGYVVSTYKVDAATIGVPQRRRRLILLAIKGRRNVMPVDSNALLGERMVSRPRTAREALAQLTREGAAGDPLARHRQHSPEVLARIAAVPVGGNRFDLPQQHRLACHVAISGRSATASYGRVKLDEPAPTMTTRCVTPACGSFIHPIENRGLTLREAAAFQTFPSTYQFEGDLGSVERQIGNAVPVLMATVLGEAVMRLLQK